MDWRDAVTESFAGQTVDAARRALTARFKSGSIESAELDARMLVGAVLGLDLTGLISAAGRRLTADESTQPGGFRAPPPRRRAGRAHSRQQGILGTAAATLGRDAGAAARHRNRGRTGAGNAARLPCPRSSAAHRRPRHRLRCHSAGAAVGIVRRGRDRHRHQRGSVTNSTQQCGRSRPRRSRCISSPAIMRRSCRARSI